MKKNFKQELLRDLSRYKNKSLVKRNAKFFQTYKGGYGEGDLFWGICVPHQRIVAVKYCKDADLKDTEDLLRHKIHEIRFVALVILTEMYKKGNDNIKFNIMQVYLRNFKYINNWDLVDLSAPLIAGDYWYRNSLEDFWEYAKSGNLWKERTAVISTLYFVKRGRFVETLELSKLFLSHKHDLIHKASGWLLREIGKIDTKPLILFLDRYSSVMPRTMLRYSIEKLSIEKRKYYLKK
ncbi:MAG: DNA alkylation repair protein [Endomicrobium sp.]|jgi:3-methyladenine DNA glycosylase AlkD|nr:DNA alkylation repair protein [Endomicrobium sp.]